MSYPTASVYAYAAPCGKVSLCAIEELFDFAEGVWMVDPTTLYTPAELGIPHIQVAQYVQDQLQKERLELELDDIGQDAVTVPSRCSRCSRSDHAEEERFCRFCIKESATFADAAGHASVKIAEINARAATLLKAVQEAIPYAVAAATAAATAAKLLSTSAGAGAGAESIAPDRFIILNAATAATIALVDEVLQHAGMYKSAHA